MKKMIKFGALSFIFILFLIATYITGYLQGQKNGLPLIQVKDLSLKESTGSIQLPPNKILLVKYGTKYAALKLIKSGDYSAVIQWWHQVVPRNDFMSKQVQSGIANLSENYERTKAGPNMYSMEDKGSNLTINFDDIKIEWSAGNWIYYSDKYGLLLTDLEDISKVEIGKYYQWTYRRS